MKPLSSTKEPSNEKNDGLTDEDRLDIADAIEAEKEAEREGAISLRDYMKKNNISCTPSA
jgi:hypothetical protein